LRIGSDFDRSHFHLSLPSFSLYSSFSSSQFPLIISTIDSIFPSKSLLCHSNPHWLSNYEILRGRGDTLFLCSFSHAVSFPSKLVPSINPISSSYLHINYPHLQRRLSFILPSFFVPSRFLFSFFSLPSVSSQSCPTVLVVPSQSTSLSELLPLEQIGIVPVSDVRMRLARRPSLLDPTLSTMESRTAIAATELSLVLVDTVTAGSSRTLSTQDTLVRCELSVPTRLIVHYTYTEESTVIPASIRIPIHSGVYPR
ncbi:hypothetical protein PENTCL1PPCAC_18281, partial [Pristionchus entomophagus]